MAAPAIGMETTGTVTGTRVGVSSAALLPTGLTVGLMAEVLVEAAVETREVRLPEDPYKRTGSSDLQWKA